MQKSQSAEKCLLLFGGTSRERLVSVATAQNLLGLLDEPACWFWAADNAVHEVAPRRLADHQRPFESPFDPGTPSTFENIISALDTLVDDSRILVLALHGGEGEDGTLPGWCEDRRIPFTGSGAESSRLAFDKLRAKKAVSEAGIRVPGSIGLDPSTEWDSGWLQDRISFNQGLVLKPVRDGSSYGIEFVDEREDLPRALDRVRESKESYLVEPLIVGVELTIGVIDHHGTTRPLPSVEIRPESGRRFDYRGKYLGAGVREICPGEVSAEIEDAAREAGLAAHVALGCYGYSRTDFLIDEKGPVFLETNTLPGLTSTSLLPQELDAAGISMRDFLSEQIRLASMRYDSTSETT